MYKWLSDSLWLFAWNEFGSFHLACSHSALGIMLFSTVRWAQMVRLFHPWPPHKAPGGHCGSLWRVCLWSSLCCLTKLLSRYSLHSFIATTCSCLKLALGNKCCAVMSSGQTGRGWCCGKTESFPGFAAVVQSESVTLLFCFFLQLQGSSAFFLMFVCFTWGAWRHSLYEALLSIIAIQSMTVAHLVSALHSAVKLWPLAFICMPVDTNQAPTPWHQCTPMTLDPPQQDCVCCHTSKTALEQPEEEFKVMTCSENSSDVPIRGCHLGELLPWGGLLCVKQCLGGLCGSLSAHTNARAHGFEQYYSHRQC